MQLLFVLTELRITCSIMICFFRCVVVVAVAVVVVVVAAIVLMVVTVFVAVVVVLVVAAVELYCTSFARSFIAHVTFCLYQILMQLLF